ncbi:MAG TPA: hypothetical protein VKO87_01985, partial [Gemmatimonadaceae bacterium]|nr:hypothetical protein [Gemmatimonadaceae bacterium]
VYERLPAYLTQKGSIGAAIRRMLDSMEPRKPPKRDEQKERLEYLARSVMASEAIAASALEQNEIFRLMLALLREKLAAQKWTP